MLFLGGGGGTFFLPWLYCMIYKLQSGQKFVVFTSRTVHQLERQAYARQFNKRPGFWSVLEEDNESLPASRVHSVTDTWPQTSLERRPNRCSENRTLLEWWIDSKQMAHSLQGWCFVKPNQSVRWALWGKKKNCLHHSCLKESEWCQGWATHTCARRIKCTLIPWGL